MGQQQEQGTRDFDTPMLSRARNPDSPSVELRLDCPKETVLWLDAISMARGMDRGPLINEILAKWAMDERHHHMVVQRVVGINPGASESGGGS